MRVTVWLFVASILILGSTMASASPDVAEALDQVVAETDFIGKQAPLLEEFEVQDEAPPNVVNATFNATSKPIYAMTCVQRKQEALRTLMNFRASETLLQASKDFGVHDTKADWRVTQWHKRYIAAASNYAFFCEQSSAENKKVTKTIHEKEGMEAQKAALKGMQDATHDAKEKEKKAYNAAKESSEKKDADMHEKKQKKLIKLMADQARNERLRSYPQASSSLMGFIVDASTGKGLLGVNITSACPFDTYNAVATSMVQADVNKQVQAGQIEGGSNKQTGVAHRKDLEFTKYYMKHGITGPEGYRCYLTYKKQGFVDLQFRILIQTIESEAIFRHAMLMPHLDSPPPWRIVLQYTNTPANLDAHLQLLDVGGQKNHDVSGHRGEREDFTYLTGTETDASSEFPFISMAVNRNTGYGPETHVIHEEQIGTYNYYVKNQDHKFVSNSAFQKSGARVFLYKGNTLLDRFNVGNAQGEPRKFWQVFSLACAKKESDSCSTPGGCVSCDVGSTESFIKDMPKSASLIGGNK